jgi:hypothetical protein
MIAVLSLLALLATPAEASSRSGFCAALVKGNVYITMAKETPSKESIEHDFRTRLVRTDKFASLSGCLVAETADEASELMRKKALEISKAGYEIELLGW